MAWTSKRSLIAARSNVGSGVLNGKLYIFGGIRSATGLKAVTQTYVYDPTIGSLGEWKELQDKPLPEPLWGSCGVAANGKIFSFGGAPPDSPYTTGDPPTDKIFVFEPDTGWRELGEKCPYPNWAMGGVYNPNDGLIYCMGGGTSVDWGLAHPNDATAYTSTGAARFDCKRIWTFDPTSETVENGSLALMGQAKRWPVAAHVLVNNQHCIHATGGWKGNFGPTDTNYRYNTETKTLSTKRVTPRSGYFATRNNPVINNRMYLSYQLVGTKYPDSYLLNHVRYNPSENTYTTLGSTLAPKRTGSGSGVINNKIYVAGGHYKKDTNHICIADMDMFSL
ncbi:Kelch repeat-containing protein [Haladaptatus sp. NG-WS-4]